MSDFYQPIDWSQVSPPFVGVLYGKESFYKEQEVKRLKKSRQTDNWDVTEIEVDSSAECVADIRGILSSSNPFFEQKRILILRNADRFDEESVIENYCKNPSSSRILLLLSRNKSRIKKWLRTLNADIVRETEEVKSYKVADWAREYARQNSFSLKKRFAEAIVRNTGDSLNAIANELNKIFIRHDGKGSISKSDITSVLYQHSSMSQFDIIEKWVNKKEDQALRLLAHHYDRSSRDPTLKIVASFMHKIENMIYVKSALNNHQSKSKIQKHVGKPPFIMKKIYGHVDNWKLAELKKVYSALCKIDAQIKMGAPSRLLLEKFIVTDFTERG